MEQIKPIEEIEVEAFVEELMIRRGPNEEYYTPTEKCKPFFKEQFVEVCSCYDEGGTDEGDYTNMAVMIENIAAHIWYIYNIPESENDEEVFIEECKYVSEFFEKRYPNCWEGVVKPW